jgi:hypothetical protein
VVCTLHGRGDHRAESEWWPRLACAVLAAHSIVVQQRHILLHSIGVFFFVALLLIVFVITLPKMAPGSQDLKMV